MTRPRRPPLLPRLRLALPLLLAVVMIGRPGDLAAQRRLAVTPYVIGHIPLYAYTRVIGTRGYIGYFKQTVAPGLGGKVTWWASRDFAAELDIGYVTSGTRVRPDSLEQNLGIFEADGDQLTATASLLYRHPRRGVLVGFGLGYMHRGGPAWDRQSVGIAGHFHQSNLTGVFSLGTLVRLSSRVAIRPSAEALVYWARKFEPSETGFYRGREMQIDLQLKLGVPIGF